MFTAYTILEIFTGIVAFYAVFGALIATARLTELGQMLRHPARAVAFVSGLVGIGVVLAVLCLSAARTPVEYTWVAILGIVLLFALIKAVVDLGLWRGYPPTTLQYKIAIVTGANSGIGFGTAKALVSLGATVIVACRSASKADAAANSINNATGTSGGKAVPMVLDLESFEGVRQFVREFKAQYNTLHVLVNNAGMVSKDGDRTRDGFEAGIGVMHFGHFLLTSLLRDYLEAPSTDGYVKRVVNVASAAHHAGSFHPSLFEGNGEGDLRGEITKGSFTSYGRAKLCNILMTYEQQRRWDAAGIKSVVTHTLHPGVVITAIWDVLPCLLRLMFKPVATLAYRTPAQTASLLCLLIVDTSTSRSGGIYLHGGVTPAASSPLSRDLKLAARLWEVSERVTHTDAI